MNLKIKYIPNSKGEKVCAPFYATEGSAGMDLSACLDEPAVLKKGEIKMISTGIAISLPSNEYVAYVYARSGLACKKGICLANSVGVIDSDYRGEIKVVLYNQSKQTQTIQPGERVAQLVITPVLTPRYQEVASLSTTDRGDGGFGSTGK